MKTYFTPADEWAEAARELSRHFDARAAQRHAWHRGWNIRRLNEWAGASESDKVLAEAIRALMLGARWFGPGERAQLTARALALLADALTAPDTYVHGCARDVVRHIPYNPGVGP